MPVDAAALLTALYCTVLHCPLQVLSGVRPQALLLTGDLVDAKTRAEGSQQHPEEWQVGLCVCCVCRGAGGGICLHVRERAGCCGAPCNHDAQACHTPTI